MPRAIGNFAISPASSVIGGLIVDPLTGAMWDIKDVQISLRRSGLVQTMQGTKRVVGYEAHINPQTGVMETAPVYEERK